MLMKDIDSIEKMAKTIREQTTSTRHIQIIVNKEFPDFLDKIADLLKNQAFSVQDLLMIRSLCFAEIRFSGKDEESPHTEFIKSLLDKLEKNIKFRIEMGEHP